MSVNINEQETLSRIKTFKDDLACQSPIEIARKHIVFGECAVISPETYFCLRDTVAKNFSLHPNDVLVVGSAKLGFSIAPKKRYQFFGDSSDLDVAIISNHFFDLVWKDVHRYSSQGGYWEGKNDFNKFLFRGWIRPDMLPSDQNFKFAGEWWEFFNSLSASREFDITKISGAIYKKLVFSGILSNNCNYWLCARNRFRKNGQQ